MMRAWLTAGLMTLMGCGGSSVMLRFENGGQPGQKQQGLNDRAPTTFAMKLVAVYLAVDVDPATQNNIGDTEMIYLNPACQEDISHCELGPGTAPDDGQPYTHFVTDYFDFDTDSATVNAAINAQARSVVPGTYRYARMEFCKGNTSHVPNVKWAADGQPAREFSVAMCGVTSAAFSPALEVQPGQSLGVTLGYDLSQAITDTRGGLDCTTSGTGQTCVRIPTFIPSAAILR